MYKGKARKAAQSLNSVQNSGKTSETVASQPNDHVVSVVRKLPVR